jgi:hypothetical protein
LSLFVNVRVTKQLFGIRQQSDYPNFRVIGANAAEPLERATCNLATGVLAKLGSNCHVSDYHRRGNTDIPDRALLERNESEIVSSEHFSSMLAAIYPELYPEF